MRFSYTDFANAITKKEKELNRLGYFDAPNGQFKHLNAGERTLLATQFAIMDVNVTQFDEIDRSLSSIERDVR